MGLLKFVNSDKMLEKFKMRDQQSTQKRKNDSSPIDSQMVNEPAAKKIKTNKSVSFAANVQDSREKREAEKNKQETPKPVIHDSISIDQMDDEIDQLLAMDEDDEDFDEEIEDSVEEKTSNEFGYFNKKDEELMNGSKSTEKSTKNKETSKTIEGVTYETQEITDDLNTLSTTFDLGSSYKNPKRKKKNLKKLLKQKSDASKRQNSTTKKQNISLTKNSIFSTKLTEELAISDSDSNHSGLEENTVNSNGLDLSSSEDDDKNVDCIRDYQQDFQVDENYDDEVDEEQPGMLSIDDLF